jgi:hypothetical protein
MRLKKFIIRRLNFELSVSSFQFSVSSMANIVLGITGSIAAYKAADIVSQLTKAGHQVTCVLTKGAVEFVTPLTLATLSRRPVVTDLFAEKEGWQPGHIQLADDADLLLIAPATANVRRHGPRLCQRRAHRHRPGHPRPGPHRACHEW